MVSLRSELQNGSASLISLALPFSRTEISSLRTLWCKMAGLLVLLIGIALVGYLCIA